MHAFLLLFIATTAVEAFLFAGAAQSPHPTGPLFSSSSPSSRKPGYHLTKTPSLNKGASFTHVERAALGLRGLFPAGDPPSLAQRVEVAFAQMQSKPSPIEKYIYLHTIQDSDETLYYAILAAHTAAVMPFVYTPTVGEACQKWSTLYRHTPRGLYISSDDAGHVREILDNWVHDDIRVICVTDGERILGLGDLGANGMGIPIGKLALYTACAGIPPSQCLPVSLDVGTNNPALLADPSYLGLRRPRAEAATTTESTTQGTTTTQDNSSAYDQLIHELIQAAQNKYGRTVLVQFEDFGNGNAFRLLERYRSQACCFNDDIQGTAAVVLAGILAALPLAHKANIAEHTFLFLGAGEAGVGIADMVAGAIARARGCSLDEARRQVWLFDSRGLITSDRGDRADMAAKAAHKLPFAHPCPAGYTHGVGDNDLLAAVKAVRPTALIGVSAQAGAFTPEVLREMLVHSPAGLDGEPGRPLVFALSNPTSKAECTALEAYTHTDGRCIFASGSPFDPVTLPDGRAFTPGQGNNAYIFPGVGLAAVASGATSITDEDFYISAVTLAKLVPSERLAQGAAYPPLGDIVSVSLDIAVAVAGNVFDTGRASVPRPADLRAHVKALMYTPGY